MPSDAERFRFLAKFRLHVSFHDDHVTLMWQKKVQNWEASPPYYPVASGKTLEDATDAAIARYNRKHGVTERTGRDRVFISGRNGDHLLQLRQIDEFLNNQTDIGQQWGNVAAMGVVSSTMCRFVADVL